MTTAAKTVRVGNSPAHFNPAKRFEFSGRISRIKLMEYFSMR